MTDMPIRPRLVVRPGLLINLLACSAAAYGLLCAFHVRQDAGVLADPAEALLAGLLALTATVLHEVAHAVVGALTGRRVEKVVFGLGIAVHSSGDSTPARRSLAVGAGPATEILAGAAFWAVADGMTGPFLAAAVIAVCNGACNLLPIGRLDGAKLLRFVRLAATGNAFLPCLPRDCPACTGTVTVP